MSSLFQKLFTKTEVVDQEKVKDQARLSFESTQFDKALFLRLSNDEQSQKDYLQYLNHILGLDMDQQIDLATELTNLEHYLRLYKSSLRDESFFYKVDIKGVENSNRTVQLYPGILLPLVRNACYQGYNSMEKYPMRIRIQLVESTLKVEVSNRVNHHIANQELGEEIPWFKARLNHLYSANHTLIFNSNSSLFKATLFLNLNQ